MSSIHSLGGIVESLEKRLAKFKVDNPTEKQLQSIEAQLQLINSLRAIYDTHSHMTLYDTFIIIQQEADKLIAKDDSLQGLIVSIPFKENADTRKYGYINLTL